MSFFLSVFPAFNQKTRSSFLQLFFFLFILPALLSYFNLVTTLNYHNVCIVDPAKPLQPSYDSDVSSESNDVHDILGIYRVFRGSNYFLVKSSLQTSNFCVFSQYAPDAKVCGWPSSPTISRLLAPRMDIVRKKQINNNNNNINMEQNTKPEGYSTDLTAASIHWDRGHIPLVPGKNRWCLTRTHIPGTPESIQQNNQICTREVTSVIANPNQEPYFPELPLYPPPRGLWGKDESIFVHCYLENWDSPGTDTAEANKIQYKTVWNPLAIPCTLFFIVLQIIMFMKSIARPYNGESGCMGISYKNVIEEGELWRIFTSAFSHTNYRHLIFNLYNFYIVGACLEKNYGTIPFFNLNIALIILTSLCTILIANCCRKKVYPKNRIVALGYSSVSFAWSIVICLERSEYPVLPWNAFPNEGPFNVMPTLQLLLSYIALPRDCSFLSNIVGMLLGLFIHWDIPDHSILVPHLMVPITFLLSFIFLKKIIPLQRSLDGQSYVFVENKNNFWPENELGSDQYVSLKTQQNVLYWLRIIMIIISLFSLIALDHVMGVSQCLITTLFSFAASAFTFNSTCTNSLMRAYFLSVAIYAIVDSMSAGSWLLSGSFVRTKSDILLPLWGAEVFFVFRWIVNVTGMVVTASILEKRDNYVDLLGGIFGHAKIVGDWLLRYDYQRMFMKLKLSRNFSNVEDGFDEKIQSEDGIEFQTVKI